MTKDAPKNQRGIATLVSFILMVTCTSVAQSQDVRRRGSDEAPSRSAIRAGIGRRPAQLDLTLPADAPSALTRTDAPLSAEPGRSKLIAGGASGVLPGLGSFYAGHARHGVTHLAIHVLAGTLALSGSVSCLTAWGGESDCNEGMIQVAAVGWLVNWGWSIVTAINDAGAFNARHSRP